MILALLAPALLAPAHAASTFDAHGFHLVGFTDDPTDALQMAVPKAFKPGSFYFGALGEYADSPLVRIQPDGEVERLLDNVLTLNLSGGWAPISRLRFDVTVPAFATSSGLTGTNGFSLGDLRLGANVVIFDGTFGLSVVPLLDLPTGDDAAFLGHSGVSASALLSSRLTIGRGYVGASAGPSFVSKIDLGNLKGADRLLVGAQAGVSLTEALALNTELRSEVPFGANEVAGTDTPAELLFYGRHRFESGGHLLVGGSTAVSSGASAAAWRAFIGGGFGTTAKPAPKDTDGDGFLDPSDACVNERETVNLYRDEDGCPDVLGALAVDVTLAGKPVTGAEIIVEGNKPMTAQSSGTPLRHAELMPGDTYKATARLGCYVGSGQATIPEGEAPLHIDLVPDFSAQVRIEVYDAAGKPLDGAILSWEREVTGCVPEGPTRLRDTHTGSVSVGVGKHTVFVTVDGYNIFEQAVELAKGDDKLIIVKLAPTRVKVTAERIEILEKVFFEFDGDKIDDRSIALLDEVAAILKQHPEILLLEVGGHTDSKGSDVYNQDLSQRRVNSVRQHLISRGVAADRLVAKGYGEANPIADNKTSAGRANNRRVEFTILKHEQGAAVEVKTIDQATIEDKAKAGVKEENRPTSK